MSIRTKATRLAGLVGAAALLGGLALSAGVAVHAQVATPTPASNVGGPSSVPSARFYGSVVGSNGSAVPTGTTITATIGGVACGFGTVSGATYVVDVQAIRGLHSPGRDGELLGGRQSGHADGHAAGHRRHSGQPEPDGWGRGDCHTGAAAAATADAAATRRRRRHRRRRRGTGNAGSNGRAASGRTCGAEAVGTSSAEAGSPGSATRCSGCSTGAGGPAEHGGRQPERADERDERGAAQHPARRDCAERDGAGGVPPLAVSATIKRPQGAGHRACPLLLCRRYCQRSR